MDSTDPPMDEIELIPIPVCPRCGCLMYPGVACVWPHQFTAWICHCQMSVVIGDDLPPREFCESFSLLLAHGHLQVPR